MAREKKRRPYASQTRAEAAQSTRQAILAAARHVFLERGYVGATMAVIAAEAGIALDTVYAAVGRKPALFRQLVETAISGGEEAVSAEERDYVRAIRAESDAARKLKTYAAAIGGIQPRLAPIFKVLQTASQQDQDLAALWQEIASRRAANMRVLAQDLAATGQVRSGLSIGEIADILWSMNSPEFFLLLVEERGWTPAAFETWLGDAWARLLLDA